ncbi:uncharacterized protein LOC125834094 isoform X5 [Solanum verrucosum]|uniref:uncharacterized protein LOC125834094 isoform X5 n=1 Tax=Solanum verrucosum TaxID=315347 RepID=UPI0020D182FF|nr:uncharacterized protein LOC125834094 isoform X5 [Solanum verrucosum]
MGKVGMEKLCPCQDKDIYHDLCSALERCVHVDEDYKSLLLFIEKGGVAYGGDRDNPRLAYFEVEADPLYMNFLANTKLDGTSYVSKVNDQNGLTVFIKYERDRELEIHGVEKGQDNVREKCELGRSSKALKTNARKNRMENGILSKKQGNEDMDLDNRKQRIDVEIVPGKEQKMKGGILSKKRQNEDMDLDNRKQRVDVNIGPGKEQQMKDGILSKRQGNEDRDLDNRNHRIDVMIVHGKKQKMNDGILSKKRRNEDRDLDNWKHIIDANIIPGKEQKIQNDSKFMDVEVKIEPQEDSDSLKEAISQSEVEILENVGAEVGWGSSSNPFVPSVEHCLNLDATIIDSRYRKEVLNLLMTPYNGEEYKKLWKDIRMRLPSSSRNGRGKSLLSLHKGVNQEIKRAGPDKDKKLNIMRGFFFWLEHLTQQDAFQPWEDAECLQTLPGSP